MLFENLKNLRKAKGLSQEELAQKLNVVRQTISKWEKGTSVPDSEMLIKIAEALDTTPAYLMGWEIEHENKEKPITNTDDGRRDDIQKFTAFLQGCSEEETKALFLMSRAYLATLREDASDPQAED